MISLPFSVYGKDCDYILEGCLYPILATASQISGQTPNFSKDVS